MTAWRSYILAGLLLGAAFCRADSEPKHVLSPDEYRAQIDSLLDAADQMDNSAEAPHALQDLPERWSIHTDHGDFDISTEGLRRDVRKYNADKNDKNADAISIRLDSLRQEIDDFEKTPPDTSAQQNALDSILRRREFRDVHGPTILDRFKRWALEAIFHLLRRIFGRLFGSSVIPTVGKYFVYGLMVLAGLALLYLVYRAFLRDQGFEEIVPHDLPVSAKEWAVWLSEARAAAAKGDWREAVHLAYWAGISFLERQGFWKPDRARTPREYLRLISAGSEQREILITLTRIFELAWYAKRDANESTFSQTLEQLEKLGCR